MASGLKLYNTLTREKVDFEPIDPDNVRLYVCGPTVYDFAHIGNARPVIVFDVLFRLLRHLYGADKVTYVRNITDVDDKINARALRDFGSKIADGSMSLNEAIRAVTGKTESQFHEDVAALGCLKPTHEPRATDNIDQMKTIIQRLLDLGHAYVAEGSEGHEVLFSTASMADYGMLSKRKLEDQQAGARVAVEGHKMNPADFVLWKQSADTEPGWAATFTFEGKANPIYGRPGWHIECSAMADRYLWEEIKDRLSPKAKAKPHQFDIHGGGLDLIFPHHENEIAQSCCAFDNDLMATVWMHNGFLQVEGRKMSKSEGNFVTINELLETPVPLMADTKSNFDSSTLKRRWNGLAARYSMLQTKYREPIDWTAQRFAQSSNELVKWYELLKDGNTDPTVKTGNTDELARYLADDLDTWSLITDLRKSYDLKDGRRLLEGMDFLGLVDSEFLHKEHLVFQRSAESADPKSGLTDLNLDTRFVRERISQRLEYLKAKNFTEADRIRDELAASGVHLKDSKDAQTGERATTWELRR
ncbi:cysteine--tRNA ligase [Ciceribacter sp. L1K23]|uniref:cysteine--tRNA ligase n=1 Tax=Ciceribacter sp. L1K23 TaxID=2820276 RepID=UPI001B839C32|nr:cysteine--tRNA ligase [Ciceribacter sp. L1K23]MBR0556182.1 cysteine--tRNA ligase [Ciceribacter sp. L1K23]